MYTWFAKFYSHPIFLLYIISLSYLFLYIAGWYAYTYQSTSTLYIYIYIQWRSSPERILWRCVQGKQELKYALQYSYNSNVSILLVSLLSRASESLRTTHFHFFWKCFYTCLYYFFTIILMNKVGSFYNHQNIFNHSFSRTCIVRECPCTEQSHHQ